MFCKNCGKEIQKDQKFCGNCGCMIQQMDNTGGNPPKKSNSYAIVGFVLSMSSFILGTLLVPEILGLIFSILGLKNAQNNNADNKGLAIAGIIISSIMLFIITLTIIFFLIIAFNLKL